jgi:hypothetical protein
LFRPENELEEALLVAAQSGRMAILVTALANADVYLPVADSSVAAGELPLPTLKHDGSVPIFSSPTQLLRFAPAGSPCLRVEGRALAAEWPAGRSLALNPGGDLGAVLEPDEVLAIRDAPQAQQPGYLIGEPADEPAELLAAVCAAVKRLPDVRAAYRGLLLRRAADRAEPVIGVQLETGANVDPVVDAVAAAGRRAGAVSLAVLPIVDGGGEHPIARFLLDRTAAFYVRKS